LNFLERQLEDPVRFARLKRGFYVGLAVILLFEIGLTLAFPGHPHFGFEFAGWGSLYGLISCVAIIVLSKFIGKHFLMRGEDHYDA
jgi:hypothetical protein